MKSTSAQQLAKLLKERRVELGLSAREVARRSGVNVASISRLEHAEIPSPQAEGLTAIARVLGLPAADLFVCADWIPDDQLPTFEPYLRAKYGNLTADEFSELDSAFARVAKRHGYNGNGPAPGEDEV